MSERVQAAKQVVRDFHAALDNAPVDEIEGVLAKFTTDDWLWRGMHPFYEQTGAAAVADTFWKPIRAAFSPLQRRPDVFLAGVNSLEDDTEPEGSGERRGDTVWVQGEAIGRGTSPGESVVAGSGERRGDTVSVQGEAIGRGTSPGESVVAGSGERRGDTVSVQGEAIGRGTSPGESVVAGSGERRGDTVWVAEMGQLLGLFDAPWLAIPPTRKMCFLRYAEFNRIEPDGRISESAMFMDIPSVMRQAGHNPFPPQTGSSHVHPGPMTHAGLLYDDQDAAEGERTQALVDEMIADLTEANEVANASGSDRMPREVLAKCWAEDMIWSGPEGIGATYTIDRYQQQHQYPFRFNLTDKVFNGHVTRIAEGDYATFFGWSNLTNRATGGFMGLPAGGSADMRVVDVYRRDGDKLAENWVFIDLLHWLSMQGLDVLARMRQLTGQEQL